MTSPTTFDQPLPLDDQLCFSLYTATLAITRLYKPVLDRIGITYPQFLVLLTLHEEEGRTLGSVAKRLTLEPSTITPLVRRLEKAGLVERRPNPDDERQVRLHLTEAGRTAWGATGCLAPLVLERSGFEVPELIGLMAQLRALRDALSAG